MALRTGWTGACLAHPAPVDLDAWGLCPTCRALARIRHMVTVKASDTLAARVARSIAQAKRHGHPTWSHLFAYGPCARAD
jgi:hypothetical protein